MPFSAFGWITIGRYGPIGYAAVGVEMGMAAALTGLFFLLKRQWRAVYFFAVGLLLLTVADEVGIWDVFVLILTLAPIVLLIKDRGWYFRSGKP